MTVFLSALWTLVLLTAQTPAPALEQSASERFSLPLPAVQVSVPQWELTSLTPLTLAGRNLPPDRDVLVTFDTAAGEIQETVRTTPEGTVMLERTLFANVDAITITLSTAPSERTIRLDADTAPQQVMSSPLVRVTPVSLGDSGVTSDLSSQSSITERPRAAETSAVADTTDEPEEISDVSAETDDVDDVDDIETDAITAEVVTSEVVTSEIVTSESEATEDVSTEVEATQPATVTSETVTSESETDTDPTAEMTPEISTTETGTTETGTTETGTTEISPAVVGDAPEPVSDPSVTEDTTTPQTEAAEAATPETATDELATEPATDEATTTETDSEPLSEPLEAADTRDAPAPETDSSTDSSDAPAAVPPNVDTLEPADPAITDPAVTDSVEPRTVPTWLRSLANVGWYLAYTLVGVIIAVRITLLCKYWVAQSNDIEAFWRKHKTVPRFARLDIVRYFSVLERFILVFLFALTLVLGTLGHWAARGFSESVGAALGRTFTNPWTSLATADPPGVVQVIWYVMLVVFLLACLLALVALVLPRAARAKDAPRTPLYVLFALLVPGSGLLDEDTAGVGLLFLLAWAVIGLNVLRDVYALPFQFDLGIWGSLGALAGLYLLNAFALLGIFVWSRRKQQQLERTVA